LLSTIPSQLSSMLLQVSVLGLPGVQNCMTPPTQFCTVFWQAPVPHVDEPSPLSTMPSQLSSTLLQVSGVPGGGTHEPKVPVIWQVRVPVAHAPGSIVPHDCVWPGLQTVHWPAVQ
jgi:hypothetical protein